MPGLGASFGRGAATNYQQDMANSDCILFMGSNMAEAQPVGFRWPMEAKEKGATLIHVDPRFTRMSAVCDLYVGIRSGSDIAFLGGLVNYVLTTTVGFMNTSWPTPMLRRSSRKVSGMPKIWQDCLAASTSSTSPMIPGRAIGATRNPGRPRGAGRFEAYASGEVRARRSWPLHGWQRRTIYLAVQGQDKRTARPDLAASALRYADSAPALRPLHAGGRLPGMRLHAGRVCARRGIALHQLRTRADHLHRLRAGLDQHTTGVQIIRTAGILQLLLGNMGRPGGGIMALRGHSTIQGATDISTLYDTLPGYLPQPAAYDHNARGFEFLYRARGMPTGYWANFSKFIVSLLKAWYGDAATPENDFGFSWLPRVDADYSQLAYFDRMAKGGVKGYFLAGQNPAGGGPNAGLHRAGLRNLEWLVVLDWFETESAVFWKNDPNGPPPSQIGTEVFFIPAAAAQEKEGSLTNTQRLIQWHRKAIDPSGDCRSDAWFFYNLGKRLKQLYAGSTDLRIRRC